jgi:hypothetical protein
MAFSEYLRKRLAELDLSYEQFATQLTVHGYPITKGGLTSWLDSRTPKNPKIANSEYRKALAIVLRISESELMSHFGMETSNTMSNEAKYGAQLINSLPKDKQTMAIQILETLAKG